MNHTCLCLPSRSWSSFTTPARGVITTRRYTNSRLPLSLHLLVLKVCNSQVFYELLQLIKTDKERRQKPPESNPKPAATNSTKTSTKTARKNGGVRSVPEVRNSRIRANKRRRMGKKISGRRCRFRRMVRNFRRRIRRLWRRVWRRIAGSVM